MTSSRLKFLVPKDAAEEFESIIAAAGGKPARASVAGQAIDPSSVSNLVTIIVALGGGATATAFINKVASIIVEFIRTRRVIVKLNNRTFENMSADEIAKILHAEAKTMERDT
mgnify:CR=1 FL=1